jgi:hypothetical protein
MLSERIATKGLSHGASELLDARELAELFCVPESWVREQARLGNLPSFKLGHYVASGSKKSNATSRTAPVRPLDSP